MVRRFELLDCLRGVAAIAVVFFHLTEVRLEGPLVPQGYLAVDFFFVLSGFVIANAYQAPLSGNMKTSDFILKRMIRLYPLSIAGAIFGLAILLAKFALFPNKVDSLSQILMSGALNIFLLPTFWGGTGSHYALFPGDGPLWSLFFELVINVIWATLLVKRSTSILITVAIASAALLVQQTISAGTENLGFDPDTFLGGTARVCFGFTVGILIYRWRDSLRTPTLPMGNIIVVLGLFALLALPAGMLVSQQAYDLVCAIILLPLVVVLGIKHPQLKHVGRLSGDLSYPVYVLHYPILLIASGIYQAYVPWANVHMLSIAAVSSVAILSWGALKLYDEPVRARLSMMRRANAL